MQSNTDIAQIFAACAGRLEAEQRFASAWGRTASDMVDRHAAAFDDLITAVAPDGALQDRRQAARIEHIGLLWDAAFSLDQRRSELAQTQSREAVRRCQAILL
jgi:hypothetical protein